MKFQAIFSLLLIYCALSNQAFAQHNAIEPTLYEMQLEERLLDNPSQSKYPITLVSAKEDLTAAAEKMGGVCNLISHQVELLDECFVDQAGINFPLYGVSVTYAGTCEGLTLYAAVVGDAFSSVIETGESGQVFEIIPTPGLDFAFYWSDGVQQTSTIFISPTACLAGGTPGCTQPYADNYNPAAMAEDGSCVGADICDCAGTRHTYGALSYLANDFPESGDFDWEGQIVDFDCPEWGYECGDINDRPDFDPFGVCSGGLPPNRGCAASCAGDLNGDGTINVDDFIEFNSVFGSDCD